MNYDQAVHSLFSLGKELASPRQPALSSAQGARVQKFGLENISALAEALGNPHLAVPCVHIAGTNGKGSTAAMLESIVRAAGLRTGLYTSPHLETINERIRINGENISDDDFAAAWTTVHSAIELLLAAGKLAAHPTFFECITAMAFVAFQSSGVQFAIYEVGLGGRFDATNIVQPDVAVITAIDFDHENYLGHSIELIAAEKAGIIKHNIPVVIGEHHPETAPVFEEKAKKENAPLSFADHHHYVTDWKYGRHTLDVEIATTPVADMVEWYTLDLAGIYQTRNLVTVLESVHVLRGIGWKLEPPVVRRALREVKKLTGLHGRWEIIHEHPDIILDVAHNEDGIRQLLRQIEVTDHEELHIVLGLVKDKAIDKILSLLPGEANYYFTRAQIPRALPEEELAARARAAGLKGHSYATVPEALEAAKATAKPKDLIVVCGSVFVVGEV